MQAGCCKCGGSAIKVVTGMIAAVNIWLKYGTVSDDIEQACIDGLSRDPEFL